MPVLCVYMEGAWNIAQRRRGLSLLVLGGTGIFQGASLLKNFLNIWPNLEPNSVTWCSELVCSSRCVTPFHEFCCINDLSGGSFRRFCVFVSCCTTDRAAWAIWRRHFAKAASGHWGRLTGATVGMDWWQWISRSYSGQMTTIVSLNQRQPGQVKATSKLKAMMSIAVMIVFLNVTMRKVKRWLSQSETTYWRLIWDDYINVISRNYFATNNPTVNPQQLYHNSNTYF